MSKNKIPDKVWVDAEVLDRGEGLLSGEWWSNKLLDEPTEPYIRADRIEALIKSYEDGRDKIKFIEVSFLIADLQELLKEDKPNE